MYSPEPGTELRPQTRSFTRAAKVTPAISHRPLPRPLPRPLKALPKRSHQLGERHVSSIGPLIDPDQHGDQFITEPELPDSTGEAGKRDKGKGRACSDPSETLDEHADIPGTPGEDHDSATAAQDDEDMSVSRMEGFAHKRAQKASPHFVYNGLVTDMPTRHLPPKTMYVAVPARRLHISAPTTMAANVAGTGTTIHDSLFRGSQRDAAHGNSGRRSSQWAEPPIESDITGSNWSVDEQARKKRRARAKYTDEVSDTEEDDKEADAEELSDADVVTEVRALQTHREMEVKDDGEVHDKTPSTNSEDEDDEDDEGEEDDEECRDEDKDTRDGEDPGGGDERNAMEGDEWYGIEQGEGDNMEEYEGDNMEEDEGEEMDEDGEHAVDGTGKSTTRAGRYPAALRDDCDVIGASYHRNVGKIALKHNVDRNTVHELAKTQFTAPRINAYNDFQSWFSIKHNLKKKNGKNDYRPFGGSKHCSYFILTPILTV